MIKIGIIGSDSSHTLGICKVAKDFPEIKITGLFGEDEKQTQEVFEKGGFEYIAKTPDEMLDKVDAVMITCRDGIKHLPYARPYLERGIPTWIDKPFTTSVKDAEEIMELSQKYQTPVTGGSFVKLAPQVDEIKANLDHVGEILSGYITFPIILNSEYSGLHFYSHHLIEVMLSVFGLNVKSINTKITNGKLVAIASYQEYPVIMNYASNYSGLYIGLNGNTKSITNEMDISIGEHKQFAEFLNMIQTKKSPYSLDFFLTAVKISNAIDLSIKENREVMI